MRHLKFPSVFVAFEKNFQSAYPAFERNFLPSVYPVFVIPKCLRSIWKKFPKCVSSIWKKFPPKCVSSIWKKFCECVSSIYYINTCEIPGFLLLLKNHIFIARSERTIFLSFTGEDISVASY